MIEPQFENGKYFSDGLALVKAPALMVEETSRDTVASDQSGKPSQSTQKSGCFIATAVYGSELASEVLVLRTFRDDVLLSSRTGRTLVSLYYAFSPPVARLLSTHLWLQNMVRKAVVKPIVNLVRSRFYSKRKEGEQW